MHSKTLWGCLVFLCLCQLNASSQSNAGLAIVSGLTISELNAKIKGIDEMIAPGPVVMAPPAPDIRQTVTQSTSLRRGPGASFLVIRRMHPGYKLRPLGDFGQRYWMHVQYGDTTGWVKKALLETIEGYPENEMLTARAPGAMSTLPARKMEAISSTAVRIIGPDYSGLPLFVVYQETSLRASPDSKARSLRTLPQHARVKVLDPRSERHWTKISYQGFTGWARKDLLDPLE